MFRATRESFARWRDPVVAAWRTRRTRRLAGLFLFEFLVVVLGVLVAQMVQDYAARARAEGDARAALARSRDETANARGTAAYWLNLAPCLTMRLDKMMMAAASGEPVPPAYFERPNMPYAPANRWTEATTLAARRAYGDQLVTDFADIADMAQHMAGMTRELAGDWAMLQLIDPSLGTPSLADRSNARLAAARIKARLFSLTATARALSATADARGVTASARAIALPPGCARTVP